MLYDAKDELIESYLLVKGDRSEVSGELETALIGAIDNAYGFEALLPSDKAGLLGSQMHYEKPNIDQIVVHYIKDRR